MPKKKQNKQRGLQKVGKKEMVNAEKVTQNCSDYSPHFI